MVLLDVRLPGRGVRPRRRAVDPAVRTLPGPERSESAADVVSVIRRGARGYITKAISGPYLCEAIRRVHDGEAYFSSPLAGFVRDAFRDNSGTDPIWISSRLASAKSCAS